MRQITILIGIFFLLIPVFSDKAKNKIKKGTVDRFQNRLIDYQEFQKIVDTSADKREEHRLTEIQFIKMMTEMDTVILDARSESRFNMRHIKGAIGLPFTEFTETNLAKVIPNKNTKILIYCNNNFEGSPESFAAKAPAASLNLSTNTSLNAYGYKNIFELGPLLDTRTTKIPFEGKELESGQITDERVDPN